METFRAGHDLDALVASYQERGMTRLQAAFDLCKAVSIAKVFRVAKTGTFSVESQQDFLRFRGMYADEVGKSLVCELENKSLEPGSSARKVHDAGEAILLNGVQRAVESRWEYYNDNLQSEGLAPFACRTRRSPVNVDRRKRPRTAFASPGYDERHILKDWSEVFLHQAIHTVEYVGVDLGRIATRHTEHQIETEIQFLLEYRGLFSQPTDHSAAETAKQIP